MEKIYAHGRIVVAADASARVSFAPPTTTGRWRITDLAIVPNETSATNGTNYASIELKQGSTAAATARTTAATSLTQNTGEALTLVTNKALLEATLAAPLHLLVDAATNGTGVAVDLCWSATFEQLTG